MWKILSMIISEKQILQLMNVASAYMQTIQPVIDDREVAEAFRHTRDLLLEIRDQQSDELKEITNDQPN